MFDILPRALASVASVLFPIFASYKALKSADPGQLHPWLMYWVVLACVTLVESWTDWVLVWFPFYHYIRLFFLLYLVLPQTQGARVLYQTHVHPWLEEHENRIDDLIGSAHERLRSAGLAYLRQAIEYVKTEILGLPADPAAAAAAAPPPSSSGGPAQSYTQALLARFSMPVARWPGVPESAPQAGGAPRGMGASEMYSLFTNAMGAYSATPAEGDRAAFVATQRDRLRKLLLALDSAAEQTGEGDGSRAAAVDEDDGGLRKSRSEPDFERIDPESGAEDEDGAVRRRTQAASGASAGGGSWMPWGWGGAGTDKGADAGKSSGVEQ